ncbi:MAG TPA: PH domain-containing protein [Burkholderiales bacterium]|nr:PH domain-containing protein [Burkholderiales bacterium]
MASYVDQNLLSGETVVHRAAVSRWSLAPRIALGIILLPLVGLGLVFLVWAWILYKTTEFAVTDKRIIAKTSLISRSTVEMFLDKVESLHVEQTVLGRVFDFGTVTIRGTGSTEEPIRNISAPLELRRQFMQAADLYRQKVK